MHKFSCGCFFENYQHGYIIYLALVEAIYDYFQQKVVQSLCQLYNNFGR